DEAAFRQASRVIVIRGRVALDGILWQPVAAVLAYDHGTFLTGLDVLRHQQHAPGDHVGIHIDEDLVAGPLRFVVDQAPAWVDWGERGVNPADDFLRKRLAKLLDLANENLRRLLLHAIHAEAFAARSQGAYERGVIEKVGLPGGRRLAQQTLDVLFQFNNLA